MEGIHHIVWDWNGTLFQDGEALIVSTLEAFSAAGHGSATKERYQRFHGKAVPLFFEQLAGRPLAESELRILLEDFRARYTRRLADVVLDPEAADALANWKRWGGSQSLLSLYAHEKLVPLVAENGIAEYFDRIAGARPAAPAGKAPHLAAHLTTLDIEPAQVLLVGDSVDDAAAARDCGIACVLYFAGKHALHRKEDLDATSFPVVERLSDAVSLARTSPRRPRDP